MSDDPRSTAATYFEAWMRHDFDTLRSILDDQATFRGPLGSADSGEECLAGLQAMAGMITEINVLKVFVDGSDVLTWYDLRTEHAPPAPTANWMHVEDGRITRIRATFDPRGLLGGA